MLFLLKHSNSYCAPWADTVEALNRLPSSATENYPVQVMSYYRYDGKINLFQTKSDDPANYLSLGVPTTEKDQSIAITPVDRNKIIECVTQHKNVFFAYYTDISIAPPTAIAQSAYFYRDLSTGNVYSFDTGELCVNTQFSIWYHCVAISNSVIYMSVNPNLVAINSDVVGEHGSDTWYLLNNETPGLTDALIAPKPTSGCFFADAQRSVLVVTDPLYELKVDGDSIFNGWGRLSGPDTGIKYTVSNFDTQTGTTFSFEAKRIIDYLTITVKTGTYLDTSQNSALTKTILVLNQNAPGSN
jgi:hypothetical protein